MVEIDGYAGELNKVLLGKEHYFFLINDSNNELKQHYDSSYKSNLDCDLFRKSQKSKEDYFKSKGINYGFFVIPDKSVILRDYLPFDTEEPVRCVDGLSGCVYDTLPCLGVSDCRRNDTNLNPISSFKLVSYFLSVLHGESRDYYEKLLQEKTRVETEHKKGDLFSEINWSKKYDKLYEKYAYSDVEVLKPIHGIIEVDSSDIPREFRKVGNRNTICHINLNSISNKRAVVFHDSSLVGSIPVLTSYYRETIFYWDHWYFNKDLIDWFKPDVVLEVRMERFLDNAPCPIIDESYENDYPLELNVDKCALVEDELIVDLNVANLIGDGIKSICDIFINDDLIHSGTLPDGKLNFTYKLDYKYYGYSQVHVCVRNDSESENEFEFAHDEEIFIPIDDIGKYFSKLKGMFIGKDNILFPTEANSNEVIRHFSPNYKSNFDISHVRKTFEYKKNYLDNKNIGYDVFSIADKSVVLNDCLGFSNTRPNRVVDKLGFVHDIKHLLKEKGYLSNDIELSDSAIFKTICYILSIISNDSFMHYENLLSSFVSVKSAKIKGGLCTDKMWSYGKNHIYANNLFIKQKTIAPDDFFIQKDNRIPLEINTFDAKKAHFYVNEDSISNKKLLIFHDSLFEKHLCLFASYFQEVLVYNSKGFFLRDVVEWFDPDNVIELYSESTIELSEHIIDSDCNVYLPAIISLDECTVNGSQLNISISGKDLFGRNIETVSEIMVNGEIVGRVPFEDGICNFTYGVSNRGYFFVDISVCENKSYKQYNFNKVLFAPIVDIGQYLNSLSKSMLGKGNCLFLVNDDQNEIRQHYDGSYEYDVDFDEFSKKQEFKRNYLGLKNIPYNFFIIPDKSVSLKELLPFEHDNCYRVCDDLNDVYDLGAVLDKLDYTNTDISVAPVSSLKIVPYIISKYSNKSYDELKEAIESKTHMATKKIKGNLLSDKNWSYGKTHFFKKNSRVKLDFVEANDSYDEFPTNKIPKEFINFSKGKPLYYINSNSISNKKALILCDSTVNIMIQAFISYYREVFFFYDKWWFSMNLVKWFNPDEVIEIKIERSLSEAFIKFRDNKTSYGEIPEDISLNEQ